MSTLQTSSREPVRREIVARDGPALADRAAAIDRQIREVTLPFWFDHVMDRHAPAFQVGFDARAGRLPPQTDLCIAQARLTWTFARAHRLGYSTRDRDCLAAAAHGVDHLQTTFVDPRHGGYFWRARPGEIVDGSKIVYGQSFILYALVEFANAGEDERALASAKDLFRLLDHRAAPDAPTPAELELCRRDWSPMTADDARGYDGIAAVGCRCANTVLHWLEALAGLYRVTHDPAVAAALRSALTLCRDVFFPREIANAAAYHPRVGGVALPAAPPLSHGHNVEAGWLMVDAQEALGDPPDLDHLRAIVDFTLEHAFDGRRGGLVNAGLPGEAGFDPNRTWWPQAEFIAALSRLVVERDSARYEPPLARMLDWYFGPQMDPRTGSPYYEVSPEGEPRVTTLSTEWQAAYHDLRARWIFLDAIRRRASPPASRP